MSLRLPKGLLLEAQGDKHSDLTLTGVTVMAVARDLHTISLSPNGNHRPTTLKNDTLCYSFVFGVG